MRQRLLNGALAGALAAVFCLLAATAYTQVKQGQAEARCAPKDHMPRRPAGGCAMCVTASCGAGAIPLGNCAEGAACAIAGKVADRASPSVRTQSRMPTGSRMP